MKLIISFLALFFSACTYAQCSLETTMTATTTTCGSFSGTASVTPSAGTAPYTYSWVDQNNGAFGTNPALTGLDGGHYIVTVSDAAGCTNNDTVQIENTDGPIPVVDVLNHVSCFGNYDGQATVTVSGGNFTMYAGNWNDGTTTFTIYSQSAGTYFFTAIGYPGWYCPNSLIVTIEEPAEVLAPTGDSIQLFCGASPITLDDFNVSGTNIAWYDVPTGGSPIAGSTTVQPLTTYYCTQTVNGCEGAERLAVAAEFESISYSSISADGCNNYYWALTDSTYTSTGFYEATLTNAAGCDSIIELDLSIQQLDVSTSVTDFTISATATGMQYQWINCDNNTPLANETNQSFTATSNGNYAVVVDNGNCLDTSECISISTIGFFENMTSPAVKVYPNPAQTSLTIEFDVSGFNCEISSAAGAVILRRDTTSDHLQIDISELQAGIYFAKVFSNNTQNIIWFAVE